MTKALLKTLFIAVLSTGLALPAFAALDVTLTNSAVINVAGIDLNVSTNSTIDSISVSANDFNVVLSNGATFAITSSDRRNFSLAPTTVSGLGTETSCSTNSSSLTLTGGSGLGSPATITITPLSTTCTVVSGGGGGGGGGGGAVSAPTVSTPAPTVQPLTVAVPTAPAVTPAVPATPTAPSVAAPSPVAAAVSPVFSKTLSAGASNDDITRLQKLLAQDKEIYPEGKITGYFGGLTKKAVQRFQEKHSIAKKGETGYGVVGPKTRAKLQEVFGGVSEMPVEVKEQAATTQIENQIKAMQEQVAKLLLELQKNLQKQLQQ